MKSERGRVSPCQRCNCEFGLMEPIFQQLRRTKTAAHWCCERIRSVLPEFPKLTIRIMLLTSQTRLWLAGVAVVAVATAAWLYLESGASPTKPEPAKPAPIVARNNQAAPGLV